MLMQEHKELHIFKLKNYLQMMKKDILKKAGMLKQKQSLKILIFLIIESLQVLRQL